MAIWEWLCDAKIWVAKTVPSGATATPTPVTSQLLFMFLAWPAEFFHAPTSVDQGLLKLPEQVAMFSASLLMPISRCAAIARSSKP